VIHKDVSGAKVAESFAVGGKLQKTVLWIFDAAPRKCRAKHEQEIPKQREWGCVILALFLPWVCLW
jgi:hypothetical protein